jgi:hypothetical protein
MYQREETIDHLEKKNKCLQYPSTFWLLVVWTLCSCLKQVKAKLASLFVCHFSFLQTLTVNFQSYVNTMMVNLAVDEAQFPDSHELLDDFVESLRLIRAAASSLGKNQRND